MPIPTMTGNDAVQRYLTQARELRAHAANTNDPDEQRVLVKAAHAYEALADWEPAIRLKTPK